MVIDFVVIFVLIQVWPLITQGCMYVLLFVWNLGLDDFDGLKLLEPTYSSFWAYVACLFCRGLSCTSEATVVGFIGYLRVCVVMCRELLLSFFLGYKGSQNRQETS